jgi:hypothetical protein
MEKITLAIEKCLYEKLELYRQLNQLLIDERQAIVDINVDALWKNAQIKRELTDNIHAIREELLTLARRTCGMTDMEAGSFSMTYYLRSILLPPDEKQQLRKLKLAIEEEKNQLAQAAADNKKYVNEYLSVIDEIMAAAADNSGNAQYTNKGSLPGSKAQRCLIHAEV